MSIFAFAENQPLEPLALIFRRNLARNSSVIHRRHVHQETSGKRDVTGDTRAFFADGLLGNLHQNFLAFFEQIGNQRRGTGILTAEAAPATASTLTAWIKCRPGCALRVSYGTCRRPHFSPSFQICISPSFRIQESFGFGLRFLDLQLFAIFFFAGRLFRLVWECLKRSHLLELRTRSQGLRRYRLAVLFSGTSLFFQFFKSVIFFELLGVIRQVSFLFFNLFFGNSSCRTRIGGRQVPARAGNGVPRSRLLLFDNLLFGFRVARLRGIPAKDRSYIHAFQALLLTLICVLLRLLLLLFLCQMRVVLLVQRLGLVLGKQRLIFGKTSCDPGRYIGMLSRTGTPTSRPGRLLQTLVFGNGLARQNDGLVSRTWAVFRTSALMTATFRATSFRTATRI